MTKSAAARARLSHPVIDSDGHWLEFVPVYNEFLKAELGASGTERFWKSVASQGTQGAPALDAKARRDAKLPVKGWWPVPTKATLDRAAIMIPELMYRRLGDFGLDYAVLYPTAPSLTQVPYIDDEEIRRGAVRAHNEYAWEMFSGYADRLTPIALIANHTPAEAIAELEHVKKRGFKGVCFAGLVSRPTPDGKGRYWDTLALDSDHDYDPVWAKVQELGLAATFHTATLNFGYRTQRSNFTYNHIGHFAQGCEALCKAFFLGGVSRRFPKLRVAFLEGGAGWAVNLYNDLVRHWKIRNPEALEYFNPDNLDREKLHALMQEFGTPRMKAITKGLRLEKGQELATVPPPPELYDDFSRAGITRAEQIRDLFTGGFYFGCEGEDPLNGMAFNTKANACGAKLSILLGSDIGHFDVLDMTEVLEEAYELFEHGIVSEAQFREFTFENAARFWTSHNPDFFKGTVVEKDVAKVLATGGGTK